MAAVFVFACCACTLQSEDAQKELTAPILTVNGEKVSNAEYAYFYKIVRSEIITEYAEKYAVTEFTAFWDTEFDGRTPAEELEKRTADRCIRAKIELLLCRENGIYNDISFEGLKTKAEAFNAENENQSGVVGLTGISMNTFYTYYIETGVMELKNRLEKDVLNPTEAEIQAQMDNLSAEVKTNLPAEELRNYAFDKAVNEKYENLISEKISEAEIL